MAVSKGMKTLYTDGIERVLNGDTTLEEILRVTQKDTIEA
jgi:type II secretory ATPase GspE/PulE/Tfp pilus assembly ATPase PilB-like protein